MGKKISEFPLTGSMPAGAKFLIEDVDGSIGDVGDYYQVDTLVVGNGDMLASVYDPTGVADDAFDMDNMVEGSTNLILTPSERAAIIANSAKVTNQTHTGQVTGATALTLAASAITDWPLETVATGDMLLFVDATDGMLKRFDADEITTDREGARIRAQSQGFWASPGQV